MLTSAPDPADTSPTPASPPLHGHFDRIESGTAIGWAARGASDSQRLELELLMDGLVVARTVADEFRADVRAAGFGNGCFGFGLRLPEACFDGATHRIEVRERISGAHLDGGPIEWAAPGAAAAPAAPAAEQPAPPQGPQIAAAEATRPSADQAAGAKPEIDGCLDDCLPQGIVGWAARSRSSRAVVEVELLVDGEPSVRAIANRHRSDLSAAAIGSGHHGFVLTPPERIFDNVDHVLAVREVTTGQILKDCPTTVRFNACDLWDCSKDDDQVRRRWLAHNALAFCEASDDDALGASQHATLLRMHEWLSGQSHDRLRRRVQAQLDRLTARRCRLSWQGWLSQTELCGTLLDQDPSADKLTLELLEGEVTVASADVHGSDAGGFALELPEQLLDGELHSFSVRVMPYGGVLGPWSFLVPARHKGTAVGLSSDPVWDSVPAQEAERRRARSEQGKTRPNQVTLARLALQEATAGQDASGDGAVAADLVKLRCALGEALLQAGEHAQALEQFDDTAALDPKSSDPVVGALRTLLADGRETEAQARLARAMAAFPKDRRLLGLADELAGRQRTKQVRMIAFYLPQFHPTPENDQWWGKGFTEWHNVGGAAPLFQGHLQPRRPTTLGYYDLRLPEAVNAQFELARRYGIDGFCYYYYWFEGRRILERPLQDLVDGRTGPFPFCICWANEDWTRSWDGSTGDVLLAQNHSPESDFRFIQDLEPLLRHPEYIRVDGKPMVLIYRADKLATPKATVQRWRQWCRDQGIGELYLCAVQSFGFHDPLPLGFDAAVEFPPHCPWERYPDPPYLQTLSELPGKVEGFSGIVYDYQAFAKASMARPREPFTLHRTAMVAWDNTARRGKSAAVYQGFSVDTFQKWVLANARRAAIEQADAVCFVNAWNEWAEGSVMEPDVHFGHQILESAREAKRLANFDATSTFWRTGRPAFPENRLEPRQRVLLIGHDAFPSGAQTNMLNMARTLKRLVDIDVTLMLIDGGELLPEYEKVATTHVIGKAGDWRAGLQGLLRHYAALGARKAICNTVVTGDVCEVLKDEGYKVVGLLHELPTLIEAYSLQAQCWRFADKTDAIVAASKVVANEFAHRYWPDPTKVLIAPQGIAFSHYHADRDRSRARVREELGLPVGCWIVLGCGYGDTRKGIDLFVQMAGEVARNADPGSVAFLWVGALDNTLMPYVTADVQRLGIGDLFRVTGRTKDPARYFIAGDVFALTSREDPFPSVVMEAFDARMPVVAFDGGGGYVDIVGPQTGALVPYLDVAAMAAVVSGFLGEPERLRQVGANNHAWCRERFGYAPYMRKLLALLADVPAAQVAAGHLQRQAWFSSAPRPRITAIVPNFNYARYLELRLRTIAEQTLAPDEIIVLDDASSDHSVALIHELAQRLQIPVQVIVNEKNTGNPFAQWAKGLERASGDLIWIAEADDYCEPTLLETLAHELADEQVVMAWTDSIMVDEAGRGQGAEYKDYYARNHGNKWRMHFRMPGRELIDDCLFTENVVPNASAVLFRRSAVRFPMDPLLAYRFSGDWWFWLFLAKGGDVVYRADPLNYHRRHAKSVMGDVLRSGEALLPETMGFYERVAAAAPELVSAKVARQALARMDQLYGLFPVLQQGADRLARHPAFADAHRSMTAAFAGAQAAAGARTQRSAATLVLSDDVLGAGASGHRLISALSKKHHLQVLVLGAKGSADRTASADRLPADATDVTLVSAPDALAGRPSLASALAAQLDKIGRIAPGLYSHGLLAHCAVAQMSGNGQRHWTLLADGEFAPLMGGTAVDTGVDVETLSAAVRTCSQARYLGSSPSHAFARLVQRHRKALDRLELPVGSAAGSTQAAEQDVFTLVAVARGVPQEAWLQLARCAKAAGEGQARRLRLRILAWGDELQELELLDRAEGLLQPVAIYQPPASMWALGHCAVVWRDENDAAPPPSGWCDGLPVLELPRWTDTAAWRQAAEAALGPFIQEHGGAPGGEPVASVGAVSSPPGRTSAGAMT
jgi:glycosyltransferase involved in cell wall biosynthesis/tetratricopeptide (TPR) repeat protein